MFRALNTAATGMAAQQQNIEVIANNMANTLTTGFRKSRVEFQDLIYQNVRVPGGTTATGATMPTGIQVGQGTRTVSTQMVNTQGSLEQTGGQLDLAIEGEGYFQVERPDGQLAYTRAGNLKTDAQGQLVTVDGFLLEPSMSVPEDATSLTVAPDGTVSVSQPGEAASMELGRLQLATFANPSGLEAAGRGLYLPTSASGQPLVGDPGEEGVGTIAQGALERANVDVVTEMISLISSQRAYEINQKIIDASDRMLQVATER